MEQSRRPVTPDTRWNSNGYRQGSPSPTSNEAPVDPQTVLGWERALREDPPNERRTAFTPDKNNPKGRIKKGKKAAWRWMQPRWSRDWNKRRQERLKQDAQESRAGVGTFMTMAEYAIRLAASTEPNPDIRRTKRRDLTKKWREYSRKIIKIARS